VKVGSCSNFSLSAQLSYAFSQLDPVRDLDNPRDLHGGRNSDLRLLGAHIIGQEACELIGTGLIALETQATAQNFIKRFRARN
jgi:hypothetical protein